MKWTSGGAVLFALSLLTVGACAGGGQGRAGTFMERGVGLGTPVEIVEKTKRIFELHQFEIELEQGEPDIFYMTRWRVRMPFEDEDALGVRQAESRVTVRARPRSPTAGEGAVYRIDVTVDQRVMTALGEGWTQITLTQQAREYASRILADFRREFDVGGVRRYEAP
jgi:hypothetical protein